jgi:hypothetical protein
MDEVSCYNSEEGRAKAGALRESPEDGGIFVFFNARVEDPDQYLGQARSELVPHVATDAVGVQEAV